MILMKIKYSKIQQDYQSRITAGDISGLCELENALNQVAHKGMGYIDVVDGLVEIAQSIPGKKVEAVKELTGYLNSDDIFKRTYAQEQMKNAKLI